MFATKPRTAVEEFADLQQILSPQDLAFVLDRRPETISRLRRRRSFHRSLERLIDDLWSVACVTYGRTRSAEDVRFFLISRHPRLNWSTPAEVIREGNVSLVLEVARAEFAPGDDGDGDDDRRRGARLRFLQRSQGFIGIDLDALDEVHEAGWGRA